MPTVGTAVLTASEQVLSTGVPTVIWGGVSACQQTVNFLSLLSGVSAGCANVNMRTLAAGRRGEPRALGKGATWGGGLLYARTAADPRRRATATAELNYTKRRRQRPKPMNAQAHTATGLAACNATVLTNTCVTTCVRVHRGLSRSASKLVGRTVERENGRDKPRLC